MDRIDRTTLLGAIRLGVGAALVVAPGFAGRIWVGENADGRGTRVFARALGARDLVLGARILQTRADKKEAVDFVKTGVISDVADVVATIVAFRHLSPARRLAMPLIAGAVGALGYAAAQAAE
ncbi:MAG TPA: hypothetical protein VM345_14470 [Acidimicrobiales bacterium]|nr:hypothetical protein [Acidimicrobiales bacterium]